MWLLVTGDRLLGLTRCDGGGSAHHHPGPTTLAASRAQTPDPRGPWPPIVVWGERKAVYKVRATSTAPPLVTVSNTRRAERPQHSLLTGLPRLPDLRERQGGGQCLPKVARWKGLSPPHEPWSL